MSLSVIPRYVFDLASNNDILYFPALLVRMYVHDCYRSMNTTSQSETHQSEYRWDVRLRILSSWGAVIAAAMLLLYFCGFLIYHTVFPTVADGWFLRLINAHFAATLGVPLCGIAAACVVLVLKSASGPIEFEILGLKLRGAAGPVVLWVLCFLVMITAIHLLW